MSTVGRANDLWLLAPSEAAAVVARAEVMIDDAARLLAQGQQVDWVSDAAERYRVALSEAQQALVSTRALAAAAHRTLAQHDALAARTCADARSSVALRLLGGLG